MDIYVAGEKELKMYGHKGYNYNPKTYLVHMLVHRNRNKKLHLKCQAKTDLGFYV